MSQRSAGHHANGGILGAVEFPGRWVDDALCAQTDPEIFFPEKGGSTREAKSVCAACPVAAECLDYALATSERFGVWGNTSERERRALMPEEPDDTGACGTYPKGYNRHTKAGQAACDDCRSAAALYKRLERETGSTPGLVSIFDQEPTAS